MRYKAGHKEEARARMIAAASRGFRRRGFGGIGVDGLAKEAEVTSGAFYSHFSSKEAAFKEAVVAGIEELCAAVLSFRKAHGAKWIEAFADFYLGYKRVCELGDSCALQSLSPEVGRSDAETRSAYEAGMLKVADAVAEGLEGGTLAERRQRAWALLSILSGASRSPAQSRTRRCPAASRMRLNRQPSRPQEPPLPVPHRRRGKPGRGTIGKTLKRGCHMPEISPVSRGAILREVPIEAEPEAEFPKVATGFWIKTPRKQRTLSKHSLASQRMFA